MKIAQELNKLKNVVIKCQAVNPGVKFSECESSIEKLYLKKRELQAKLKKCNNGLMELTTDLSIVQEALGTCEGKNRILTPQISELNTKHVQLTNLAAKHQNQLNRCRSRAFNNCRETEQKCNTQCAATSSKSKSSHSSISHSSMGK
jgi:chromosome segregation ATPase